jgi:mannose-6-phosphate isomerase-like protein (cupin superfamily)
MKRRTFVMASLASAPFALPAQQPRGGQSTRAVHVKRGADRFDEPYALSVGHMECKVSARDTGGRMAIFEALTHKPDRPVKHLHHDQDEWFHVVTGDYEMYVGNERFRLGPGDSLLAPRKVPHVWACVSEEPGRIIALLQPAGTIEAFFRELPQYIARKASPEEFQALNRAHGMEVVGPRLPM